MPSSAPPRQVAIGGIGGSGTRLGAALLQRLGYYIGDDLNEQLDNLWFTLLFKRRAILTESRSGLESLLALFWSRMSGSTAFSEESRARVLALADEARLQHDRDWLRQRAKSMLAGTMASGESRMWGWKEPNTHIVIERVLELRPDLLYIHFIRQPLDMAFSDNQNQLENWGPIFLNRNVTLQPRASLAYWCAAHRYIAGAMRRHQDRILAVDFDALCSAPERHCDRIAEFLGVEASEGVRKSFSALVERGRPGRGRFRAANLKLFDPEDIAYVKTLGYDVT